MGSQDSVTEIIRRADEVLRVAYVGLETMKSPSGFTKNIGLRNVLTFGRSVTFVLQNLRSKDERFEQWYEPHSQKMKNDPIFCFFRDARNDLEKKGKLGVATSMEINSFSSYDMSRLEKDRPPGATSFFIADALGGSGWIVDLPNGEKLTYYIELPQSIGKVEQYFSSDISKKYLQDNDRSTVDLAMYFLDELSVIVNDARRFFLNQPSSSTHFKRRIPGYLRVVK